LLAVDEQVGRYKAVVEYDGPSTDRHIIDSSVLRHPFIPLARQHTMRARADLAFAPTYTLESALQEYAGWLKTHAL
jgi:nucleoside-diphosphate-sugar epimerase